jgi:hypothetical protein
MPAAEASTKWVLTVRSATKLQATAVKGLPAQRTPVDLDMHIATPPYHHAVPGIRTLLSPRVAGYRMAATVAPYARPETIRGNITTMIQEGEQGKIVEVKHEVAHKTVEVWVE